MIRLKDASLLALTKLRTRRLRTTVTIIVSGLLFGLLITLLVMASAGFQSTRKFNEARFDGQYLVWTQRPIISDALTNNSLIINRAQEIYTTTVGKKEAAAERLGLHYEPDPTMKPAVSPPGGKPSLNLASPAAWQALKEYYQTHPKANINLSDLKTLAKPYGADNFYEAKELDVANGSIRVMRGNNESFSPIGTPNDFLTEQPLRVLDSSLTDPFMLPGAAQASPELKNAIPVIVPYSIAAQQLGLEPLPDDATPTQQLKWLKTLQSLAANVTFTACYRNEVSRHQINSAIRAATNDSSGEQASPITYSLPSAGSCGAAKIASDTRALVQKQRDQKQNQFDQMFGIPTTSDQEKITFRIIGLTPDQFIPGKVDSAVELFQSFLGPSNVSALMIPKEMYQSLPGIERYREIFTSQNTYNFFPDVGYIVGFSDIEQVQTFVKKESCEEFLTCANDGNPFWLNSYGSSSLAIANLEKTLFEATKITVIVIVVIAIIIMGGTLGRLIVDERKETAVFRAIGATRLDIAGIYLTYAFFLSLLIAAFALILGLALAFILDQMIWQQATVVAQLAYGLVEDGLAIHFFTFSAPAIWIVGGAALITGVLSMLLPLQHNIGRNPIKDLRDE